MVGRLRGMISQDVKRQCCDIF